MHSFDFTTSVSSSSALSWFHADTPLSLRLTHRILAKGQLLLHSDVISYDDEDVGLSL